MDRVGDRRAMRERLLAGRRTVNVRVLAAFATAVVMHALLTPSPVRGARR